MGRTIKQQQVTGGWVDESLSQEALNLIRQLPNADEVEARLRKLLGQYRLNVDFRNTTPQGAVVKDHMERLAKHAQAIEDGLNMLPAREHYELQMHTFRATGAGFPFDQFKNELAILAAASTQITQYLPHKGAGEKPKILEKMLLSDTTALIEDYCSDTGITKAADTARNILYAAGVRHHLPAKPVQAVAEWRTQAGD